MIAISYRREDSLPIAGRLYDRLQAKFGKKNIFMDFDSIPPGADFRQHIREMIERSNLVIAIIGPNWLGEQSDASRRIDNPADFVRLEIAYALKGSIPVIPLLINNTSMPEPETLPADIQALAFRHALPLDSGVDFHNHADRLITGISRLPSPTRNRQRERLRRGAIPWTVRSKLILGASAAVLLFAVAALLTWYVVTQHQQYGQVPARNANPTAQSSSPTLATPAEMPTSTAITELPSSTVVPPATEAPSAHVEGIPDGSTVGFKEVTASETPDPDFETNLMVRIAIKRRPNAMIDHTKVKAQTFFYDTVGENSQPVLTDADVSYEWLTPKHDWVDTDTEVLAVTYIRPKSNVSSHRRYLGYIVRLYYDDKLQAARAEPIKLLTFFPPPSSLDKSIAVTKPTRPDSRASGRVYVYGSVKGQGPQEIPPDENYTVSKAIIKAGGFGDFANKRKVKLTRKTGQEFTVDLKRVIEEGHTDEDLKLQPDDQIYIPQRLIDTVPASHKKK
jgi:hypothetical protein